MQPELVALGAHGQTLVLQGVFADFHFDAVAGEEFHRLAGRFLAGLYAGDDCADMAGGNEHLPKLGESRVVRAFAQVICHLFKVLELLLGLLFLFCCQCARVSRLLIEFKIPLSVLRRGEGHVHRHADRRVILAVEVLDLGKGLALFQPVEVCLNQFAVFAVFLHAGGVAERLVLDGDFLFAAFDVVFDGVGKGTRLLVHAFAAVALVIEGVQRCAGAVKVFVRHAEQAHLLKGIDVRGRAVVAQHDGAGAQRRHRGEVIVQRVCSLLNIEFGDKHLAIPADADGCFLRGLRGKAGEYAADCLVQLAAGFSKALGNLVGGCRVRIELSLAGRILVGQAGQHLADAGDVFVDMAARIDDAAVAVFENDVGVAAHDLNDERADDLVAELAQRLNVNLQNTVARDTAHVHDVAAAQMFAQQHAEHRRFHGAGFGVRGQVNARGIGGSGKQKAMVFALGAN